MTICGAEGECCIFLSQLWLNDTIGTLKEVVCIVIPTHKPLHRLMGHGWLKSIDKWRAQRPMRTLERYKGGQGSSGKGIDNSHCSLDNKPSLQFQQPPLAFTNNVVHPRRLYARRLDLWSRRARQPSH